MADLNHQIVSALKTLIRQNGGEIHGYWPDIADRIACEIGGDPDDFIVKKFEEHLRAMGLKYFFEDHKDIDFMRDWITGELNFVDRKLVFTACEVSFNRVTKEITWKEVKHE
ncbi:hypothetical protein [Pseudomonas sp. VI4.1]|uniref:hypothetical protein n=1 Tax=Pseudomonas sp. VI4.1 TaxID=1941346 RepID=UPI0009CBF3D0|nr:hypothetical protein [Pseudomonas sp. VI4.1]OPK06785.1 hypothetical protein BZ163_29725 [Pseudomonas sp. VI4.1]